MNIWYFHHYATPPKLSGMIRPYAFGKCFSSFGYKTSVFASSFLHYSGNNLIKSHKQYIEDRDEGIPFVYVKTSDYFSGGIARIKNMLSFFLRLFPVTKKYSKLCEKPDVIIASSPHPLTMLAGVLISKRYKIPCICEIRDFWPEVFFYGDKLKKDSFVGKLLIKGEHWIYKKADSLVFLKEGDTNYILENGWSTTQGGDIELEKCFYINNGIDIKSYDNQKKEFIIEDPDLISGKFNVVYVGTIRPVNNVGNILDCAKLMKQNKNIQFIIYGDGSQLGALRQRVIDEKLENVKLKGYIDRKYIPFILSKSSVNILNYSNTKYNWMRGNSSNKLFEYMASGKPIISNVKMGYCLLDKFKCGISLETSTPAELYKSIMKINEMSEVEYNQMCINARTGAKSFDFGKLSESYVEVIKYVLKLRSEKSRGIAVLD